MPDREYDVVVVGGSLAGDQGLRNVNLRRSILRRGAIETQGGWAFQSAATRRMIARATQVRLGLAG